MDADAVSCCWVSSFVRQAVSGPTQLILAAVTVNHVLYLNLSLFAHDSFRRQVNPHTKYRASQTAQQLLPIDY